MENTERKSETRGQDSTYWADKGNPKEQFDIIFGGRRLEVANFSDIPLRPEQLQELDRVITEFSQIRNGEVFDQSKVKFAVRAIFIDNEQPIDSENTGGVNGAGVSGDDGIIKLYPRALEPISHRVSGVSNFEGTLIHEFAHSLFGMEVDPEIYREWIEKFEWLLDRKKLDEFRRLGVAERLAKTSPKDWINLSPDIWKLARFWEIMEPERCVTSYAQLGPEDDFAESMVAALRNPGVLDYSRFRFIKKKFLSGVDKKTLPKVDIQKR